MPEHIEIYIDRIVLEGYGHMNKAELNVAVQEHLSAMISEQGLPDKLLNNSYHGRLNGGQMLLPNQPKIRQAGNDIANGIYQGISSAE